MSQAGEIDVVANNPDIPTDFVADVGNAIPISNTLEILGTSVAAGTTPVETTASGNTLVVEVQISQAVAATDATKIGLANFSSAAFSVDANGFVTLNGGGGAATNIDVDAFTAPGTDPVVPSAGNIILTGAQVASGIVGANVIRTNSLAANTVTIEIQRSAAVAASDSTKNGVAHFDSGAFAVDVNGFVTLAGGGLAIDSVAVDASSGAGTNPVAPTASGLITVTGAQVASGTVGTNVLRSNSVAANTYSIEIQRTASNATTDVTKNGVAHFKSTDFTVDTNGFVSLVSPACTCVEVTGDLTLAVNTCYYTNFAEGANLTLPATASLCDEIEITYGIQGLPTIVQNAGQRIQFGDMITTTGITGGITSEAQGDCVKLKCVVAGASTRWTVVSSMGNWLIF